MDKSLKEKIKEILSHIPKGRIPTIEELWDKEADQILALFEGEHKTKDGYCCACGYDIAGFKERLKEEHQK